VKRVAVGVSGSGRSLANLLAFAQARCDEAGFTVAGVIASRPDCKGVDIARAAALPVFSGDFSPAGAAATRPRLYAWLAEQGVDLVALAGFLKLFPVEAAWRSRVLNIHPALLPRFGGRGMYGDRVHAAVLAAKAPESGATIHFVDDRYDEGRIIAQTLVAVHDGDTPRTLADRVYAAECRLYPAVLSKLALGELPLSGGKIWRLV
jgi:folate-dependent phosphoribosylglycinamide formyltransferase PurN